MLEDKTGVSPIIAIILMVAITVVLAATIYVWVAGFGGGAGSEIAMSLDQITHETTGVFTDINFTVQSASGDGGWEDLKITLAGTEVWNGDTGTATGFQVMQGATMYIDGTAGNETGAILAGQTIWVTGAFTVGDTLVITDHEGGSTVLSLDVTY